jgi:hypothetical protein
MDHYMLQQVVGDAFNMVLNMLFKTKVHWQNVSHTPWPSGTSMGKNMIAKRSGEQGGQLMSLQREMGHWKSLKNNHSYSCCVSSGSILLKPNR